MTNDLTKAQPMKIAFLLYPGFTALDIVGPFDVLSRLPGADAAFVAKQTGPIENDNDLLSIVARRSLAEMPDPDLFVVPGGMEGTRAAAQDEETLEWVRKAHEGSTWTTSVCTGSLILGAAGVLQGLDATTHWGAQEELAATGATYKAERFVRQGKVITAAGVSAGIDMALFLAGQIVGDEAAEALQLAIEYDPDPPYDSGSMAKAKPETMAAVAQLFS